MMQKSIILNGHEDPKFLHKHGKTQLTATSTSYVIAMYGQETISSLNAHIQISSCAHDTTMPV